MIQVFKPSIGNEEIAAVADVLRSGWIGLGPKTAEFETCFANFSRISYAVGVNSGTAALDLAMKLLRIGRGDEVIVSTMTFVSTAHVVAHNLGMPIFSDIDCRTLNIDPDDLAEKLTPRTKAIIVTHYGGRPVDMDKVRKVAGDVPIVEDCAHATGALYKGVPVGGLGAIGCFSFHAVKNLTTGDGGMLTTNEEEWATRARSLRWLGIDKTTWDRTEIEKGYWWKYKVDELGLKCHMNDIAAAIGLIQLQRLKTLNDRRRSIVRRYFDGFAGMPEIGLPPDDDETFQSSWHLFCIRCDHRDRLSSYLAEQGVATGVHYAPIHLYRCYGNQPNLSIAEREFPKMLTLPLYPDLTDADVDRIINLIHRFYDEF